MWIVCVHEGPTQDTTENMRAGASKCASIAFGLCFDKHMTLATQLWIEWPVSYKLMLETPWFCSTERFRILFHTMKVGSLMCVAECVPAVRQYVEREYRRSVPVVQVSRYILRITKISN